MIALAPSLRATALVFATAAAALIAAEPKTRDKAPDGFYAGYTGFALPAEPVLPAGESHPSLWFRATDLPTLRGRLTADNYARRRWAAVLGRADLAQPLPAAPTAQDKTEVIHKYYGAASMAARSHAVAALLVDDPAAADAHRQRAVEFLLRAYDGPIFELDSNVKNGPVDEIYRGSWLQNYAHAYDCVQPTLTPAEDAAIRERLAREARCVHENLYRWTPASPHNHLSKPAWGLGSMALTLSGHPEARAWLARALEASNRNTRYFFSGDGLYREGTHYLVFSLTNFVPFLWHYRNVSGVDGFTPFQPVFEAMVATRNSRGWLPNLEDSYLRPTPTHLAASAYRSAPTALHSTAPLAEILAWSYRTADLGPFEDERGTSGLNYTGASWDYPLELDELLTHDPALHATAPDAAPNRFLAGGQSVLRSPWSRRGPGQRYLLFHGVAVADNHNHDDQLSFIIEAEGQLMASDSGYSRGTYAGAERTAWYNQTPAHNTLTFDGKPAGRDPSNQTPLSEQWTKPGLVVVQKTEFALPKSAVWKRAICWIADDYYVVIDRVFAKQLLAIQSYLHAGRGTLARTAAGHTWTYPADRYGAAARFHATVIAPDAGLTEKSGELTYIKGDYAPFPYLEIAWASGASRALMVLQPAAAEAPAPFAVADRSTPTHTACVVTTPTERTTIATGAGPLTLDGIESDATLLVVRRDLGGQVLAHFAAGGSYLRVDGRAMTTP
ncbi:MAG: hypothetical protein QG602_111 [Verrucomicrobiota bacterium]|nr:hypothetical protein [Verrucomicrobiota bacterium]